MRRIVWFSFRIGFCYKNSAIGGIKKTTAFVVAMVSLQMSINKIRLFCESRIEVKVLRPHSDAVNLFDFHAPTFSLSDQLVSVG